jgi:hypothetical protein
MVSPCANGRLEDEGSLAMPFASAVALSFGPVLVAILAAALILPRAWLASYAAFVIVATIIYADYSASYEDTALRVMFSALFGMLVVAALAAGLITRWALKSRRPQSD